MRVRVGLLFSRSGPYALPGEAMYAGALLAVEEIAAAGGELALEPVAIDPGGRLGDYFEAARQLLSDGVTHVVGCYTSSSRKEVLPLFEKHDGLLWYPSHYEGFETSDNVVYTGAAPNQHIVPLTRYLLETGRRRAWLVGSNYVWAWENNRIMREAVLAAGGDGRGRALSSGRRHRCRRRRRPGARRRARLRLQHHDRRLLLRLRPRPARRGGPPGDRPAAVDPGGELQPRRARARPPRPRRPTGISRRASTSRRSTRRAMPASARPGRGAGRSSARPRPTPRRPTSAVHLLARAIAAAGDPGLGAVRAALAGVSLDAPQGLVRIDPDNRHAFLRPRIGLSQADGTFRIVAESPTAVRPDPYLVWEGPRAAGDASAVPPLRLVS